MDLEPVAMLKHQHHVSWRLATSVLEGLSDEEALWCPSQESWTVRQDPAGRWIADWVEPEPSSAPPTSLAWVQWHAIWWWSTVLDRTFDDGQLKRSDVTWPGAAAAMTTIGELQDRWLTKLDGLTEHDLSSGELTSWPYSDGRPFAQVAGWVSIEFMKNVAEMCLLRRSSPHYI